MYFNATAYNKLYPRTKEVATPKVESMVENFDDAENDVETDDIDLSVEQEETIDVGEGTDGTSSE